ncbi:SusC/RagA family TonB-linked outer membrane protein [Pseudobacter ginsenosidimutans]|uniref:TonB-linked SusC/RagA family outer membrane protein n=1 Tax=Pseudobacter ginsenosidimutans TaxID=661488 RepID=A0A4Q7MV91_9BACT|nr:SusC/RagA family TonB-linked outer membrane protein [Pseudobacter ginsenosidimutans]QEC42158.1 SusC/RagA family TonB-linked outer membrane protein [Pseudobacter ginsenosidimutans]RZS71000.1 TonB-linked SusC/RagA family outer membrane protein [Pseudobacter ginsenosidimutans]
MRHLLKHAVLAFICVALPAVLLAQVSVTGTVTDAKNNPLQGVSVKVKNSNIGTSTDASGRFSLTVPKAGASLEISSVGYKTKTLQTSESSAISITMEEDAGRLDEVVVTGLATSVKRRNLANAVVSISSKELTGTAPAQTFDAALNGKVPGALINANSGAPGGGISVKLRGVTSVFGNTQPLFVVDGVFIDNSSVSGALSAVTGAVPGAITSTQDNPSNRVSDIRAEDIENIEILKGASAAAIYGSKAAAGVVIITTKRGKTGKTKLSFSQDLGFLEATKLIGQREWNEARAESLGGKDEPKNAAARAARKAEYIAARDAGKIYDYEEEMYGRKGLTRNSVVSLVGGNDKTSFYLSGGLKDEQGLVKRTGYSSKTIRLNVDHRLTDNIKLSVSSTYLNTHADRGFSNNDNNTVTHGVVLLKTPNFTELHLNDLGLYPNNRYASSNPLHTREVMTNAEDVSRFMTGVNLDAILQKSQTSTTRFIARGGFDYYTLGTNAFFPADLQFQNVAQGTSAQGTTRTLNHNIILSLVNSFTPTDNFSLTSSAGLTQENKDYNNILNVATRLVGGQTNINQSGALTSYQLRDKFQDNGFFLQEEATIMDAVTLTGGIRLDRSTNNGDAKKLYFYPKAGLSWNLTRMSFWKADFVDNLKIRTAYGQAGNFPAFGSKFTLMSIANTGGNTGLLPSTLRGRKDIAPERTSELEAGVDVSMLGGKLNLEFTVYEKRITDFLLQRPLPGSTGYSSEFLNAGDLRNRGMEISLSAQPVSSKDLKWNTTVNFWRNRSEVTRLSIPSVVLGAFGTGLGTFQIKEGRPATEIVGTMGPAGVQTVGDAEPDFQMNFWNELTFMKNFSFRFLLHWKKGGHNINLSEYLSDLAGTSADYDDGDKGGPGKGPARLARMEGRFADTYVQEAGYVRLREVAFYYTFSKLPTSVIKGLRIGVSANNFLTFTKYRGYDPEVSNFGAGFSTNVDVAPFPASKRASFHLTVDF